jgi:HD-GYP domain-containing protein (c-di-GMP phosphodiesterase class II)
MGAVLHDVGMLFVPPSVRHKAGRLTKDEWYEVQKHPILGLHLLEKVRDIPDSVAFIAYQEHERENRTGYPKQRSGRLIHRFAKIVQVADVFEAMTSPRSYREAFSLYDGAVRMLKMARRGLVPGEFVKGLLEFTSVFPIGCLVELSDGRMGRVVAANGRLYARPVISVLREKDGRWLGEERIYQIDLAQDDALSIDQVYSGSPTEGIGLMKGF